MMTIANPTRRRSSRGISTMANPLIKSLLALLSSALGVCSTTAAGAADVPFQHIIIDSHFPRRPHCKAVGDINGDGLADVVIGSAGGDGVFWYESPTWTKHRIDDGTFTTDAQLADIDRDGDLDLIIPKNTTYPDGWIVWYENPGPKGDPAKDPWKLHIISDQAAFHHDVVVGDINGDGKIDVVTRGGQTRVYIQQNPDSWSRVIIPTDGRGGTTLGDLDGDGDLDILQNGYWLECPKDPLHDGWARHVIASGWPDDVGATVADMNADGRPDVVFAPAESRGRLSWYEAPPDPKNGSWKEHVIDSDVDHIHTFKVADMNHNGRLDVVTAEMEQSPRRRVSIYWNEGSALKWRQQIIATNGSHNLRVADLNGDGLPDIVGANHGNYGGPTPIEAWLNEGDKIPLDRWTYIQVDNSRGKWGDFAQPDWLKYFGLSAHDVNGDGYLDIVAGRYFYRNPGGNMTSRWERVDLGLNVDAMLFVDVDGDKFADCIGEALPDVYWLEAKDRQGDSWKAVKIAKLPPATHVNGQGYAIGQIIPGGRPEIVLSTGKGIYYIQIPDHPEAGNWPVTLAAEEASEQGLGLGDVDGDGLIDIAAPYGDRVEPMSVGWWKNPGRQGGPWKLHPVGKTANYSADRVVVADVTGDGRADILVTEESWRTQDRVAQLFCFVQGGSRESPTWERRSLLTASSLNSLDVGDLDHDGDLDIVTCEHKGQDKRLFVLENDGRGRFTTQVIDHGKESHLGTRLYDMDGDGDLDILSVAWDSYQFLHLWRNDAMAPGQTAQHSGSAKGAAAAPLRP
jgi:FG-GAP-like repeat